MTLAEIRKAFRSGSLSKVDFLNRMFSEHQKLFEYPELLQHTLIERVEITPSHVCVTVKPYGLRFLLQAEEKRIAPIEILNLGNYESDELQMMASLINSSSVIFDVGANIGYHALTLGKAVAGSKVYAFEPIADTFTQLSAHIRINNISNVRPFNFGFSSRRETLKFYRSSEGSVNVSALNVKEESDATELHADVLPLDEFVAEQNIKIDFLKCDVEGAELLVFQGAQKTLAKDRPIIFTEMLRKWSAKYDYHPNDIIRLMDGMGYRCFKIFGQRLVPFALMDESTIETNFFFLHSDAHRSKIQEWAL